MCLCLLEVGRIVSRCVGPSEHRTFESLPLSLRHHLVLTRLRLSQIRGGAARVGEAGEGDRAGGDAADDGRTSRRGEDLQRVLPARGALPARGEIRSRFP